MPAENHTTLTPDTPVRYLKGVGPKTAERFEKLGIVTLADLLCHYPRRYIDFTKPYSIAEAPTDVECVVRAEVFAKPGGRILPGGRRMERITAGDDVSSLEITWFNNPYAAQKLQLGQEVRAAAAAPCRASARPSSAGNAGKIPSALQGRCRAGHPLPCHRRAGLCSPAAADL